MKVFALLLVALAVAVAQPEVTITRSPAAITEADNGVATFTIFRDSRLNESLTVQLDSGSSTALFGSDYSSIQNGGSINIPIGDASVSFTITANPDTADESLEFVNYDILSDSAYTIGTESTAVVYIVDSTTTPNEISVIADPSSIYEDSGDILHFYVLRNGVGTTARTVGMSVSGTATLGTDYTVSGAESFTSTAAQVTFPINNYIQDIQISAIPDADEETDVTLGLTIDSAATYSIDISNANAMILDDDPSVKVEIFGSSTITEGSGDTLIFRFTRTGNLSSPETISLEIGGTAVFGQDFTELDGLNAIIDESIDLPANESSIDLIIGTPPDSTFLAPTRTVTVKITGSALFFDEDNVQTGTIIDDDGFTVAISCSPPSVAEGGMSLLTFTVSRSPASLDLSNPLNVGLSLSGTAILGSDYTSSLSFVNNVGNVTIPSGLTFATFEMTPLDDSAIETDETIVITLEEGPYLLAPTPSATGTITNDDGSTVSLAITSVSSVQEDQGVPIIFEFSRTIFNDVDIVVSFTVGGTATFGNDYFVESTSAFTFTAFTGSITMLAGETSVTLNVVPEVDLDSEPAETVTLTLSGSAGYALGNPIEATATIENDDPSAVSVTVSPAQVQEDGAEDISVVFQRVGSTDSALPITFTVGGTASPPGTSSPDYTVVPEMGVSVNWNVGTSSVTIPVGSTQAIVTLEPIVDSTQEDDETVIVSLQTGAGYTIVDPQNGQSIIFNDDGANTVRISTGLASTLEGSGNDLVATFRRSGDPSQTISVNFEIDSSSTANETLDYTLSDFSTFDNMNLNGTVDIVSGEFESNVTVTIVDELEIEDDETVIFNILPGVNYTAAASPDDSLTFTIVNDDPTVSLSLNGNSVLSEASSGSFQFTFSRVDTNGDLEVFFELSGTATAIADYTADSSTPQPNTFPGPPASITMPNNTAAVTLTLTIVNDITPETDETIIVSLVDSPSSNYVVSSTQNTATATINNDDGSLVTLSVTPQTATEGTPNVFSPVTATQFVYTFTREGSVANSLTVGFDFSRSTATFGSDYTESGANTFSGGTGTVTFAPTFSTANIIITVIDDTELEGDETIEIEITPGSGYSSGTTGPVVATIFSDDGNVVGVAVTPSSVPEASSPVQQLTFRFTRSGSVTNSLTVLFNVRGSATSGSDYTATGATTFSPSAVSSVVIPTGRTSADVIITPIEDSLDENDEDIILEIVADSAYAIDSAAGSASGIIRDINTAANTLTCVVSQTEVEDSDQSAVIFTVRRVTATDEDVIVNYQFTGTASPNIDFVISSGSSFTFGGMGVSSTLRINAGSTSADLQVNILQPISAASVTLTFTILAPSTSDAYDIGTPSTATLTATRNEDGISPGNQFNNFGLDSSFSIKVNGMTPPNESGKRQVEFSSFTDAQIATAAAEYLQISISFFAIVDNYGDNAFIQIFSIPNGASSSELAIDLTTAINNRDPALSNTLFHSARAFLVGEIPNTPEAVINQNNFDFDDLISAPTIPNYTYFYVESSPASLVQPLVPLLLALIALVALM